MHRAGGIGDGALGVLAGRLDCFDGDLEVAHVVHGIKDAEYVNTVFGSLGNKGANHVVAVVTVAKQVLATQQHLQAGVRQRLAQGAQTLPGIFFQKAHAGVKGRAAPDFQRPVADLIQLVADRQHVFGTQTGRQQRLVGVAQDGIGNGDFACVAHFLFLISFKRQAASGVSCRLRLEACR